MARVAGLEPATVALTVRCTTIVLHPNVKMEARMGFEPMSAGCLCLVVLEAAVHC